MLPLDFSFISFTDDRPDRLDTQKHFFIRLVFDLTRKTNQVPHSVPKVLPVPFKDFVVELQTAQLEGCREETSVAALLEDILGLVAISVGQ